MVSIRQSSRRLRSLLTYPLVVRDLVRSDSSGRMRSLAGLLCMRQRIVADDVPKRSHRAFAMELRVALRRWERAAMRERPIVPVACWTETGRKPLLWKPGWFAVSAFDGSDALDEGHGLVLVSMNKLYPVEGWMMSEGKGAEVSGGVVWRATVRDRSRNFRNSP